MRLASGKAWTGIVGRHRLAWLLRVWALLAAFGLPSWARAAPVPRLLEHRTPTTLCPDEPTTVPLVLRNDGDDVWSPTQSDRVAYHWLAEDGTVVVRDGLRTELPGPVEPGATVRLRARLVAPPEPGRYRLQWAMVRERVAWSDPAAELSVDVVGDAPALGWSLLDGGRLDTIPAKGEAQVRLTLRNEGCATWSAQQHDDAMSYRWTTPDGRTVVADGLRSPLPVVEPGATVVVEAEVFGPPEPGPHVLHWEPVREHVRWYGRPDRGDPEVRVEVGSQALAWSLVAGGIPREVAARSLTRVPITLRNEGSTTWSTEAGDRLAYRWQAEDGTVVVAEGMRTLLPHAVAPGQRVELTADLRGPDAAGTHRLQWEMVREQVAWYGPPQQSASADALRSIDVAGPALAWSVVEIDPPAFGFAWTNRPVSVQVVVRNEGRESWSVDSRDRFSYRWWRDGALVVAEGRRTDLPHDVGPGETVALDVTVTAPGQPGTYVFEPAMVREHVSWFGAPRGEAVPVEITIVRSSVVLGLLLVAGWTAIGIARRGGVAWVVRYDALWVPLWVATACGVLGELFNDHSGVVPWEHSRAIAWSTSAGFGALVGTIGKRARLLVAELGIGFVTLLVLADLAYVDFFGGLVPIGALAASHHLLDAGGSVTSLLRIDYAWLLTVPLSGLALSLRQRSSVVEASGPRARWLVVGVLGLAAAFSVVRLGQAATGKVGQRVFSEYDNAGRYGVLGAHVLQVVRIVRAAGGPGPLSDALRATLEDHRRARNDRAPGPRFASANGMNLVLLQVEALQGWVVDAKIDGVDVMPWLQRAKQHGSYAPRIYDQTGQGRTSDAEYLVLSSGHGLPEGALAFLRTDNDFHTLVHALRERGYSTLSAHPYERGFWNRAALHPRYGFERSLFRQELGDGPIVGWGLADGPFLQRIADEVEHMPEPWMVFGITLSLHHPYDEFPDALKSMDVGDLEGTPLGNYLHAMRHFDDSLARLFERLESAGLAERTVVAIYGDHVTGMEPDPALLELADVGSWSPATSTLLHTVPLLVWTPDREGARIDRVGGHLDIGPTVLELLGVQPPASMIGESLLRPGPGFAALSDGSAIAPDRIYVSSGLAIPPGGACFAWPLGTPRPMAECEALRDRADAELTTARAVLDHDLQRALASGAGLE